MKIAMIGSGAAGSVFAAYLRKGGAELWLVDKYKAHMDKIAADGLVFRTPEGEEVLTGFHTSATAHDIGTMDMVILMVKATQTADVMADTMPCIGPETVVVSLQNGLGNDEVLAQFVETDRILYGSGLIGTELAGPGVCVSKPEKGIQMHFGAVHNNPKADAAGKALEACFQAGGCNASFDEDVRPYIWKKVIANSGYNGVSAVMRLKVKETFADPYGHDIVMHVWKEGCAVAQALGIGDLWPLMERKSRTSSPTSATTIRPWRRTPCCTSARRRSPCSTAPSRATASGWACPPRSTPSSRRSSPASRTTTTSSIWADNASTHCMYPYVSAPAAAGGARFSPYAKTPPVPCTGGVRYGCFVYRQRRALTGWDISAPARPRAPSNLWPA